MYPDVTVGCNRAKFHPDHPDALLNPRLIVEVLSESPERFDRGDNFAGYRTLASLTDHLLVSQRDRHVEHYARQSDGSWNLRDHGAGDVFRVTSLDIAPPVDEVHLKVFDNPPASGPA